MVFVSVRLVVLPVGDRLAAVAVRRGKVEMFVVEAEHATAALRAELDQRGIAARTVAFGLPRDTVIVKPIDLPSVDGELREMVRFELERHLPAQSEETVFDFSLLPGEAGRAEPARSVLVTAAERRVVDRALRIATEAGLRAVSITVASHALPALVDRPRGHVVWMHRVGDTAELLFLSGSTVVLSRSVRGDDAHVTAEIRRSFAVTRWPGCDAVWVSGDTELAPAREELGALGVPVGTPPYTARARVRLAGVAGTQRGVLELAVAVASAGRLRPPELLSPELRPRRLTRGQLLTAGVAAATVLLAVGALLAPGYRSTGDLRALNARIAGLEAEVRAVERVLEELERKRRLLTTVAAIERESLRPLPVLRELTELLPQEAWLTMLALDTKGVELTGQAAAAAALIPVLENSARFERAEFSSPVTRGRDREQFRIRASWEGRAAPAARGPGAATGTIR